MTYCDSMKTIQLFYWFLKKGHITILSKLYNYFTEFNNFVNIFANDTTKNDDILKSFFASTPSHSQPSILKKDWK